MVNVIRKPRTTLGLSTLEEVDRLFDDFWRSTRLPSVTTLGLPSVDIYSQDDKHTVVELAAPGFDTDDIDINVRDGVLEVTGQKTIKDEEKEKGKSYVVRESNTSFARRLVLPEGADSEGISAELDKGLLRITVPVNRPEAKHVQIKAGASEPKKLTAS